MSENRRYRSLLIEFVCHCEERDSSLSLRGTESRSNLWRGSEQAPQSQTVDIIRHEIASPPARNDTIEEQDSEPKYS